MRCGCNDEATVVQAGRGIAVTEEQNQNVTTYTISVDGSTLAGNGLRWDPETRRFHVKLAATNPGLAFDGTGALYNSSGEGPGPTPNTGATVAALEARQPQQNVVAGVWGAGYLIKPACTRASIQYGSERGFDALHLPVRFLSDGTPVVYPYEQLEHTNLAGAWLQEQDIHRSRILQTEPGLWYPVLDEQPDDPQQGWFGYLEGNEVGLLPLAEAFEIVRNSAVLLLELQFPAFDESTMQWARETPKRRVDRFLERVLVLIQRYGLQSRVVVLTNTTQVPDGTTEGRPVLNTFTNAGIRSGPVLISQADVDKHPAGSWPSEWSWAIMQEQLDDSTIQDYTNLGVYVLLTLINRQYKQAQRVEPTGALGVASGDPEYFAGQFTNHPTASNYAYRKTRVTWEYNTIDNGVLHYDDLLVTTANPAHRGYLLRGDNAWWLANNVYQAGSAPYYVLRGELCPIDYAAYTIDFQIDPTTLDSGSSQYAALAFAVTTDHPFQNLANDPPDRSGYLVRYTPQRQMEVYSWDPTSGALTERGSLDASGNDDLPKRFNIYVTADDLRFRFVNRDTGAVISQFPAEGEPAPEWAVQWRGGYLHIGQYAALEPPRSATFHDLFLKNIVLNR